ncbi:hypothetical protein BWI17_08345 [Betaproteobacteria bacterium GR16-43]|nr:hypothetical protein BWI17_08345 [Betaproteobacteria bacterium GR16-43]
MLRKLRKSSGKVTLVLIGVAALAGCSGGEKRDVYASKEDCLADWGNKPEECTPATDSKNAGRGFYYGPLYAAAGYAAGSYLGGNSWGRSTGTFSSARASGATSRAIGSSGSSSRGGFGSTGRSSSSSSGG